jgi:DNA-binding transcriptional MerR regulator
VSKSRDAFRTISEVADELDTPAHVLRFWESKFSQVKPVKRAGGRRYYRPADVDLLAGIKKLLHDDGMTIKGAQKLLREQGVKHVSSLGATALLEDAEAADMRSGPLDDSPADAVPADIIPADVVPTADPTAQLSVAINNVIAMPDAAAKGPALSLNLAPSVAPSEQTKPPTAPETVAKAINVPADPSDNDSKSSARVFHLLHKASHSKLAAQAAAIAPLLDRMQNLRDRISLR